MHIIKIRNLHMTVVFIKTHFTEKVKKKVKVIHLKANMSMVEKLKEFLSGIKEPKNMNMKDLLIKTLDSKMRVFWKRVLQVFIRVILKTERSMVTVLINTWKMRSGMKGNIKMDLNVDQVQFTTTIILLPIKEISKETYLTVKVMLWKMARRLMHNLKMVSILKDYNDSYYLFYFLFTLNCFVF